MSDTYETVSPEPTAEMMAEGHGGDLSPNQPTERTWTGDLDPSQETDPTPASLGTPSSEAGHAGTGPGPK